MHLVVMHKKGRPLTFWSQGLLERA